LRYILLVLQVRAENKTKKMPQSSPAPFRNHQNYNINVVILVVLIYRGRQVKISRYQSPASLLNLDYKLSLMVLLLW